MRFLYFALAILLPRYKVPQRFTPVCKGRDLNRIKKEKVSFLTECNGLTYSGSSPAKDLLLVVEQLRFGEFTIFQACTTRIFRS